MLAACGSKEESPLKEVTSEESQTEINLSEIDTDMFTNRDLKSEYDESTAIKIQLSKTEATSTDNSVKISGTSVTLTKDATYIISGSLNDGMIIVDMPDTAKPQLVLKSVTIVSENSAAIYIKEADKVFITLEGESTLESGGSFKAIDDSNIDGAVFSKQDLTFNGSGTLNVNSPAGHGIVGKDDLVFTSGVYNIASSSHAIQANDSVRVSNAEITTDAGKDGIHAENSDDTEKGFIYIESGTLNIESEGDGISAGSYIKISGGTFDILAGGGYENGSKQSSSNWGGFGGSFGGGRPQKPGSRTVDGMSTSSSTDDSTSMKGIKSANNMQITGGSFKIDSADDAIHSNISVNIEGGTFEIASGDDGVHADQSLSVTSGKISITQSYEGLEALSVKISGGNIKLKATDDGINAAGGTDQSGMGGRDEMFGGHGGMSSNSNGSILISGGTIYINASGDGIDANGTLEISGGHTTVTGPTQGDTSTLDYDKTGVITGGTFIGTGALNMAESFSDSSQGVIALSVGTQSAGTKIIVKDKQGNEILSHSPELSFQIVIISTPQIKSGESYTVTVGSQTESVTAK